LVFNSQGSQDGRAALATPEFSTGFPLWDQYNNPATEPPVDINSQDFEPTLDASDNQAADDFVFTYPFNNCITGVRVLGEPVEPYLWSSEGALVMDSDRNYQFRIRTITPRMVRKRCVFLTDDDQCRVHAVAPFGCSYADTHMTTKQGQERGLFAVRLQNTKEYQDARKTLNVSTSYKGRRY